MHWSQLKVPFADHRFQLESADKEEAFSTYKQLFERVKLGHCNLYKSWGSVAARNCFIEALVTACKLYDAPLAWKLLQWTCDQPHFDVKQAHEISVTERLDSLFKALFSERWAHRVALDTLEDGDTLALFGRMRARTIELLHFLLAQGIDPQLEWEDIQDTTYMKSYQSIDYILGGDSLPSHVAILTATATCGMDIRYFNPRHNSNPDYPSKCEAAEQQLASVKEQQRARWKIADAITEDRAIPQLRKLIEASAHALKAASTIEATAVTPPYEAILAAPAAYDRQRCRDRTGRASRGSIERPW